MAQYRSETAYLTSVVVPRLTNAIKDENPTEVEQTGCWQPSEPHLSSLLQSLEAAFHAARLRVVAEQSGHQQLLTERTRTASELARAAAQTLPAAVTRMREGASLDTVWQELKLQSYEVSSVREVLEAAIGQLAVSERRSTAAQAASARALSRVQAQAMSMLADLREMQNRHGQEVLGDLLKLDHATSQLGLLTDRLAVLMGGRGSRGWQKPIPMQSILRGAVGRIAAYRRVTLNCASQAAVSGFAAEGVMHLLAEVMDNATKFSPPIDQVHVYVEERAAGIVVTIEDSGLKMADHAMRRAEQAVSGGVTDIAALQGTRLGLAVVGRLAEKYGISVSFRPSSRGGTGVVVLLPSQVLSQQRASALNTADFGRAAATQPGLVTAKPEAGPVIGRQAEPALPAATAAPLPTITAEPVAGPAEGSTTANGLPVRPPGHTMATAERARAGTQKPPAERPAARDAGARFGAFHQARHAAGAKPAARPEASKAETDD